MSDFSIVLRVGAESKEWWCGNPSGSRPNFFGRQHLTFDKGRAWMPEVERPEFRKDAKPTERSYGKNVVRGEAVDVLLRRLWGLRGRWAIPQSCDR